MRFRLTLAVFLTTALCRSASPPTMAEYVVKAAFLVNLARFVEWPPQAFPNAAAPLVFCVLGLDPFGRALDDAVAGKSIEGRPLAVRRVTDARLAGGCRVLFVGATDRRRAVSVPASLPECGVLTVGDADGPAADRMIVNFTIEEGKVRFSVNQEAADFEKLRLSSRVLGLASTVKR